MMNGIGMAHAISAQQKRIAEGPPPPRQLSLLTSHKFYRPDYARVGIEFNGEHRADIQTYDADEGWIETIHRRVIEGEVKPFWRYAETRQMRRARERWEAKR